MRVITTSLLQFPPGHASPSPTGEISIRGGSRIMNEGPMLLAYRNFTNPATGFYSIGFRCAAAPWSGPAEPD